jgi:hypothetical protein
MKIWKIILVVVLIIGSIAAAGNLLFSFAVSESNANDPSLFSKKKYELLKSELKIGTRKSKNLSILDKFKVPHTPYKNHTITANVSDVYTDGIIITGYMLTLTFDKSDKLKRIDSKEVYTGP